MHQLPGAGDKHIEYTNVGKGVQWNKNITIFDIYTKVKQENKRSKYKMTLSGLREKGNDIVTNVLEILKQNTRKEGWDLRLKTSQR